MKALLSIKPVFVEEIITGAKRFEYRKKIFKKNVDTVIIYASMPIGKIIGEFTVGEIINKSPDEVWSETKEYSGISLEFFNEYFQGRDKAYAIQIKEFYRYEKPIDPYEKSSNFVPPQSFKYIEDNQMELLLVN
ncbi:Predicted transcriptional regulator, contains an HTH and PUA-like domains [Anaerosporobacter mobilis DSM 15930]|jgi:predicted transcriptional regulator|uniref:Predicted transcriptional regulator, contains an HTH and PUA-like domains n=1 Tax=Anaerosporobacter mobilis DSM 15930 TaxID=1120996 RepID=A0A1M7MXB5_9FIRM|nr:ASCH domain-containing protein [Anaerosporobacter mobilis]SHM95725.1 Predicted transcriptional regulator, contains an HTH and PUA-like domains [Anaerosporobacter mobilis DSM 15930]